LYLIPTGQNPSGATLSNERREQIYKLAQKYNLIIMEDDPYWHLRLKPYKTAAPQEPLMSLFSMDTDGRVLRFESFSKIVSSGLRLGFVVGPTPLITKIQFAQQASTLHTAGLSQAMLIVLLQKIGPSGWDAHIANVQDFYTERRNKFLEYAEKHLTGLAEWWIPSAGMFVWFKFLGIDDSLQLIQEKAISAKVLMVPGRSCSVNDKPSPYARAAFSIASDAEMDEALRRLAEMLRAETKK
jgi:kynurenine/2-aminoadipate aminotransferase